MRSRSRPAEHQPARGAGAGARSWILFAEQEPARGPSAGPQSRIRPVKHEPACRAGAGARSRSRPAEAAEQQPSRGAGAGLRIRSRSAVPRADLNSDPSLTGLLLSARADAAGLAAGRAVSRAARARLGCREGSLLALPAEDSEPELWRGRGSGDVMILESGGDRASGVGPRALATAGLRAGRFCRRLTCRANASVHRDCDWLQRYKAEHRFECFQIVQAGLEQGVTLRNWSKAWRAVTPQRRESNSPL